MPIVSIANVNNDALSLKTFMDAVLDKIVETYADYNVPLPTRQFWTMGDPAIDCDQLCVSFVQMYLGLPGDEASQPQRCTQPRTAVLTVSLSREIPVVGSNGKAPTADKIQEGSEIAAVDAWMFMELINKLDQWEPGEFGMGVIATAEAATAEGGFQTMRMQVSMVVP
jgi:hypothetical protein